MAGELDPRLLTYLANRAEQRVSDADDKWAALNEREQLLVREAAVMGFFLGQLRGHITKKEDYPRDNSVVTEVLTTVAAYSDLYPTLSSL